VDAEASEKPSIPHDVKPKRWL